MTPAVTQDFGSDVKVISWNKNIVVYSADYVGTPGLFFVKSWSKKLATLEVWGVFKEFTAWYDL